MRFKKSKKIAVFLAVSFIIISIFSFAAFYAKLCLKDEISKKIFSDKPIKCALLLRAQDRLESFLIYYERKSNLLKIISINTDMVFFDKKKIARNLKKAFFDAEKKDAKTASENFYLNLFSAIDNSFEPDFYIGADYGTLLKIFASMPELNALLSQTEFQNRDLQCLSQIEAAEIIVNLLNNRAFSNILKLNKHYPAKGAGITKLAALNFILHFRFNNARVMFCDLPVKYVKKRIEPDKENIEKFFSQVYYSFTDIRNTDIKGQLEVRNASGKPRVAEKAAWLLRDAKFDVLEWSNFDLHYEKTVIKEYRGSFGAALKAAEILKCGKIITSYSSQNFFASSIFVGRDCQIKTAMIND
jgi:hypothetical protein